ncbi:hypothetical protein [Streptomyces prasinopilosus]|uniref:hypothetical protein n=1 Tax=Streptomyces prasinopilosus TaxID=67344 RepID=UPI00111222CE|nr:hypothetical protein [Streptomyces prasinopilosus]
MVELPVLDLLDDLLRGGVSVVAIAVDDELVPVVAVVSVADAFGGRPGEGGSADDRDTGPVPVPGRWIEDLVVAVGVGLRAAGAGQPMAAAITAG